VVAVGQQPTEYELLQYFLLWSERASDGSTVLYPYFYSTEQDGVWGAYVHVLQCP